MIYPWLKEKAAKAAEELGFSCGVGKHPDGDLRPYFDIGFSLGGILVIINEQRKEIERLRSDLESLDRYITQIDEEN